jgi:hypothetical protein
VRVEIDGEPVRQIATNIPPAHALQFPYQGDVEFNHDATLRLGKHKLQVKVTGDLRIDTNLNGDKSRKFDGTLVSNVVEFEVVE